MIKNKKLISIALTVLVVLMLIVGVSVAVKYNTEYTVTLDYRYKTMYTTTHYVKYDSTFSPIAPSDKITLSGNKYFKGWFRDSACTVPWVNGIDKVKSDITLYAKWETEPS